MPQNPIQVQPIPGTKSALGITTNTVVKAAQGLVAVVTVVNGATPTEGKIYDSATVAGAGASNVIATVPTTDGTQVINFPAFSGIVVEPGTNQTISIAYL